MRSTLTYRHRKPNSSRWTVPRTDYAPCRP